MSNQQKRESQRDAGQKPVRRVAGDGPLPARVPARPPGGKSPWPWVRRHGLVLGLMMAVVLAFLFPAPGSRSGFLHPELINNAGIALIMFLQGLSLAFHKLKSGAGNWRLHVIIQSFTFIVFPIVGLFLFFTLPLFWMAEPAGIRQGLLYLCVLPSTISTSVVFTAVARGNVAGALFNAALSNLIGVILTPVLVQALMKTAGQSAPLGPLMLKIMLLTLLPYFIGASLRRFVVIWVEYHQAWIARISNAVIIFIVYSAFCDSFEEKIWRQHGATTTVKLFLCVLLLFAGMSLLIYWTCRALRLNREDRIAAYFCSVKKTLAMGVPLAVLIFGVRSDIPLILLPLMLYHPVQIFINGLLAHHWRNEICGIPGQNPLAAAV